MRPREVALRIKHDDTTRYRKGKKVLVVCYLESGKKGVVSGVIIGNSLMRSPWDDDCRAVYRVQCIEEVPENQISSTSLSGHNPGDVFFW